MIFDQDDTRDMRIAADAIGKLPGPFGEQERPRFAIRFDYPDATPYYAGMHKGAFGWAPTLATALIYADRETAERVLANAYGPKAQEYAAVVEVTVEVVS